MHTEHEYTHTGIYQPLIVYKLTFFKKKVLKEELKKSMKCITYKCCKYKKIFLSSQLVDFFIFYAVVVAYALLLWVGTMMTFKVSLHTTNNGLFYFLSTLWPYLKAQSTLTLLRVSAAPPLSAVCRRAVPSLSSSL